MVEQHDGTKLALRKIDADYDPHDRLGAMTFLQKHTAKGQIVTGTAVCRSRLRKICTAISTRWRNRSTSSDEKTLCPGSRALEKINAGLR